MPPSTLLLVVLHQFSIIFVDFSEYFVNSRGFVPILVLKHFFGEKQCIVLLKYKPPKAGNYSYIKKLRITYLFIYLLTYLLQVIAVKVIYV